MEVKKEENEEEAEKKKDTKPKQYALFRFLLVHRFCCKSLTDIKKV